MAPSAGSSPGRAWLRRLPGYLVLIAGLLLVLRTGIYLVRAGAALRYPYQLDYGEGIVWQQLRLIGQGRGYGPIDGVPAIVFHYPPLYHQVTAWLAALTGGDELQTGRTLSLACTLIAAALIARLAALLAPREAEILRMFASGQAAEEIAESWTDWIVHRLDQPGTVFVAVGAAHLAGQDSVVSMLAKRRHPAVREVAVVGVPDPQWGERPFALLVVREGQQLDARGLKEHLKPFVEQGNINKWAIPSQIAVVTDIPKTSVGKLDKKRIRIEIAQWQEAGSAFLSTV